MTTTTPSPPAELTTVAETDFENECDDVIVDLPENPPNASSLSLPLPSPSPLPLPSSRPRARRIHSTADIRKSGINIGIPAPNSRLVFAAEQHGEEHWKATILEFLHRKVVQGILLGLLILDVLVIFTELFLHAEYPACKLIVRDCKACCEISGDGDGHGSSSSTTTTGDGTGNGNGDNEGGRFLRWLAADASSPWLADASHGDGHHEGYCEAGYENTGVPGCDPHEYETVHVIEKILFFTTVFILSIFFIEICLELVALGPCKFFSQMFLALDFVVVTVSLAGELTLYFLYDVLSEIASVLIVFRLWRFVRIGHGIMEVTSDLTHDIYGPLKAHLKKCEEAMRQQGMAPPERGDDVEHLMHEKHHVRKH